MGAVNRSKLLNLGTATEGTAKELVRALTDNRGIKQSDLAERAGFAGQTNISAFYQSKNMRVDTLIRLVEALGCELVIRTVDGISVADTDHPGRTVSVRKAWKVKAVQKEVDNG